MLDYKKELIVKSAKERFARFSFKKTSMTEIAADVRMSKATLYYYYKSKDEIFNDVIRYEFDHLKKSLDDILTNKKFSFEEKFLSYFNLRLKTFNEEQNLKELQLYAVSNPYLLTADSVYYELINTEMLFLRNLFIGFLKSAGNENPILQHLVSITSKYIRGFSFLSDVDKKVKKGTESFESEWKIFIEIIFLKLKKIEKENK